MFRKSKMKRLPQKYDYYKAVKDKTDKLSLKIFGKDNNEILKFRLYNLVINLCNQVIYNYNYVISKDELYLIADYNINIDDLLKDFKEDIIIMKYKIKDE